MAQEEDSNANNGERLKFYSDIEQVQNVFWRIKESEDTQKMARLMEIMAGFRKACIDVAGNTSAQ